MTRFRFLNLFFLFLVIVPFGNVSSDNSADTRATIGGEWVSDCQSINMDATYHGYRHLFYFGENQFKHTLLTFNDSACLSSYEKSTVSGTYKVDSERPPLVRKGTALRRLAVNVQQATWYGPYGDVLFNEVWVARKENDLLLDISYAATGKLISETLLLKSKSKH